MKEPENPDVVPDIRKLKMELVHMRVRMRALLVSSFTGELLPLRVP